MNKAGFPGGKKEINRLLNQMGGISNEEKKILLGGLYRQTLETNLDLQRTMALLQLRIRTLE